MYRLKVTVQLFMPGGQLKHEASKTTDVTWMNGSTEGIGYAIARTCWLGLYKELFRVMSRIWPTAQEEL